MKKLQTLIYGDRNIFISKLNPKKKKKEDVVSPIKVCNFLLYLQSKKYKIENPNKLFILKNDEFEYFINELYEMFNSINIKGQYLRKSFANNFQLSCSTKEEELYIYAKYSIQYNWEEEYLFLCNENPKEIIESYEKKKGNNESISLSTNLKVFEVDFDLRTKIKEILKDIFSSKIVLRAQQKEVIDNVPIDILVDFYIKKDFIIPIKETEVLILKKIINKDSSIYLFSDIDQIVRIVGAMYSFKIEEEKGNDNYKKIIPVEFLGQINKKKLKEIFIKIPTSIRKKILQSLEISNNNKIVVEKMFKYYGFWKKILTSLRYTTKEKMDKRYPNVKKIKDMLYKNDRSETFNGLLEKYKKDGNYDKAIRHLSTNKGFLLKNIIEYTRYLKGMGVVKKIETNSLLKIKKQREYQLKKMEEELEELKNYGSKLDIFKPIVINNISVLLIEKMNRNSIEIKRKEDTILKFKEDTKKIIFNFYKKKNNRIIKKDASNFFKSKDFKKILLKSNVKLLWKTLSLFENKKLFKNRKYRIVQGYEIEYEDLLPGLNKDIVEIIKKTIIKSIKKIKKKENKLLKKVYIDKNVKNYNIEFSGRKSNSITLSGNYLSPGSKIPFDKILSENKILRLGIAWKGKTSCDLDHSINLLKSNKSIYFGNPCLLNKDGDTIITSSGDIIECNDLEYSVEMIDIDINLAKKENIGNMITSIIQYNGLTIDNYEVLWFMNIIDKKDRILSKNGRKAVSIQLDQMDYAIQLNDIGMTILGFYINLDENHLEVLNIVSKNKQSYQNSNNLQKQFEEDYNSRDSLIDIKKLLKKVIRKKQIVKNIKKADIIITDKLIKAKKRQKTINVSTNLEKIIDIVF